MKNEWETEADEENFVYKGYNCRIRRVPDKLHLCGYVQITEKDGNKLNVDNIEVHGGITFNEYAHLAPLLKFPFLGRWIGFDCMHAGDFVPGFYSLEHCNEIDSNEIYRNFEYVRNEIKKLVDQLIKIWELKNENK